MVISVAADEDISIYVLKWMKPIIKHSLGYSNLLQGN